MIKINKTNINTPEYWDKIYLSEKGTRKRRIDQERLNFLISWIEDFEQYNPYKKEKNLLDVGCGNAELLSLIHSIAPEIKKTGYDICPLTIQRNCLEFPFYFLLHNIEDEVLQEGLKFDIVFCGETIEHLNNPELGIEHLFSFCHDGSYLIFSVPNEHNNFSLEHIWEFTVMDIIRLINGKGIIKDLRVVCGGLSIICCVKKK